MTCSHDQHHGSSASHERQSGHAECHAGRQEVLGHHAENDRELLEQRLHSLQAELDDLRRRVQPIDA